MTGEDEVSAEDPTKRQDRAPVNGPLHALLATGLDQDEERRVLLSYIRTAVEEQVIATNRMARLLARVAGVCVVANLLTLLTLLAFALAGLMRVAL